MANQNMVWAVILAVTAAACYDPAEPLPEAVRDAVGDYDLAAALTTEDDSLPIDRNRAVTAPTGVDCTQAGADGLVRAIGLDGYLTLSEVDRTVAGELTAYGVRCNDSTFVLTRPIEGTYVLQERYLTLTVTFGGTRHAGEFDASSRELSFDYPGGGLIVVSVFAGVVQEIGLASVRWRRVSR